MNAYTGWVNEIIDQFKPFEKDMNKTLQQNTKLTPKQASLIELLQKLLRLSKQSVKFKLPLDGKLFDTNPNESVLDAINTFIDSKLNLPFNEIALEFPLEHTNGLISSFVVFAEQVNENIELLVFNKKDTKWSSVRGLDIKINRYTYEISCDFQDKENIMDSDPNDKDFIEQTQIITQIATSAIIQLLCALSCGNVNITDDDVKPSAVKQTLRKSKGKLPLFTYKVLTVQISKTETIKLQSSDADLSVQSNTGKRAHLRRGHPRVYKSGLKIWVNACSVGNKKLGEIDKTYNIKP